MLKMSSFSSLVMKTHVSALRVRQQIAIQGLNSDHFCCVDERKIFGLHVFLNVELKFWSVYSILIFLSSSLTLRFWFLHVSHRKTFKTSARFVFQATLLLSLFLFPFCSNMKLLPSIRSNRHSRQIHTEKARFQFCRFFIPSFLTHITYLPSPPKNQDFIGLGLLFTTIYKTYSLEGERECDSKKEFWF